MGGTLTTDTAAFGPAEPGRPATARSSTLTSTTGASGRRTSRRGGPPPTSAIERDYGPADLAPELAACGVDATVLMQSVDEPAENDRLSEYARAAGTVAGVVGWLPLSDPRAARAEWQRAGTRAWCGVRTLIGRDPLGWLGNPAVVELFGDLAREGLVWDVVPITAEQVAAVTRLAEAVPELRLVVDHLARPPLDSGGWQPWANQVGELARCPGVALKVSVGVDALTAWSSVAAGGAAALRRPCARELRAWSADAGQQLAGGAASSDVRAGLGRPDRRPGRTPARRPPT